MTGEISILLIEDEQSARNVFKEEIKKLGNIKFNILAELETCRETVNWLKTNNSVDLIFLDIHLADGPSLDIFNKVTVPCPVVFITAYDNYAVEAFKLNGLDYLLKPIESARLKEAIDRYLKVKESFDLKAQFDQLNQVINKLTPKKYREGFLVHYGAKIKMIKVENIAYFFIRERQVNITTLDNELFQIDYSLEQVEKHVDPHYFYRTSRQFLVNRSAIKEMEPYLGGRLLLRLSLETSDHVILSREKVTRFKQWMET